MEIQGSEDQRQRPRLSTYHEPRTTTPLRRRPLTADLALMNTTELYPIPSKIAPILGQVTTPQHEISGGLVQSPLIHNMAVLR